MRRWYEPVVFTDMAAQQRAHKAYMKKKAKASGVNIPEAQRGTVAVKLRLPPDVAEALDTLAERWKMTRSGVVAQLVEHLRDDAHGTP